MNPVIDEHAAIRNIAANTSRLLKEKGWSQGELARRSGEKPMTISRIVNAQHMPELPTTANVAEALGVTVDDLLSEQPKNFPNSPSRSRKSA